MEYAGRHTGKRPYCGNVIEFVEATRIFERGDYGRISCSNCGERVKLEELEDVSIWMPADECFSGEEGEQEESW